MPIENYFEMTVDQAIVSARSAAEQSFLPQTVFRKINQHQCWHAHPLCRLHARVELRVMVLPGNYFFGGKVSRMQLAETLWPDAPPDTARATELTPRWWKQHFAERPLRSDLIP